MQRFSSFNRRAFTIVELLVSLGIIVVLSGMMLANFHGGQQASELRLATEFLVNQARATQTSALAGRLAWVCGGGPNNLAICEPGKQPPVTCGVGGTCQQRAVPGYGLRLTAGGKTVLSFYDTNGNGRYDAGEDSASSPYIQSGTVVLDSATVPLPLDVVFRAPDGRLVFSGSESPDEADVVLKQSATGATRTIKFYRLTGKIDHD